MLIGSHKWQIDSVCAIDLVTGVGTKHAVSRPRPTYSAKAHQRANIILRCFTSGDINLLVRAFSVYVRPIVEHNPVIWSPSLKHDIDLIEKVQRRSTKRLYGQLVWYSIYVLVGFFSLFICLCYFLL